MAEWVVPWNASWSDEQVFEIRNCRYARGLPAIHQLHAPQSGRPIFALPHAVRQRRSIAEMRCTVCGQPTHAGDQWTFGHGAERDGYFMTREAPVHRDCADQALSLCPHLQSLPEERQRPFPLPPKPSIALSVLDPDHLLLDYGLEAGSRSVIGEAKLIWPAHLYADHLRREGMVAA